MAQNRTVKILDQEREFRVEELFFSITDEKGIISYGNEVFTRISGYTAEELLGEPHNIIRHPDMPRAVFQLLWDTIQAGDTIAAYVKNLAKDGRYYWVLAVVTPCDEGYLSVRLKPTSELLTVVRSLYGEMLALERQIETEPKLRRKAIEASTQLLQERLLGLGFADYDAFQQHALETESAQRQKVLENATQPESPGEGSDELATILDHCEQLDVHLLGLFGLLGKFKDMNLRLSEKSQSVLTTADSIRLLALNASVASHRLGERTSTLQVVASTLGRSSTQLERGTKGLTQSTQEIVGVLDQLIFGVVATKLQSEIGIHFLREMLDAAAGTHTQSMEDSLGTLLQAIIFRTHNVFDHVARAEEQFNELENQLKTLKRNNEELRFVQFAGKKEAARWQETEGFSAIFSEAYDHIQNTYGDCVDMGESIQEIRRHIDWIHSAQPEINRHMSTITQWPTVSPVSQNGYSNSV